MKLLRNFSEKDSVIDLIQEDYNILPILSRFGIPLGFHNKRIEDVCRENNLDPKAFLFIINFILTGNIDDAQLKEVSPVAIVDFLHNSHDYFLKYKFPHIRQNLVNALDDTQSDINPAILSFFDSYILEVEKHFSYEEKRVFPHVKAVVNGKSTTYNINIFKKHHDEIGETLAELKNIILRFYSTSLPNRMYDVLVDIYNAEEDLEMHNDIENKILIPQMSMIERHKNNPSENTRQS